MKKAIALLFSIFCLVNFALAEDIDFSGMTDKEILDVINAGRNALILQTIDDGIYRLETNAGITIVFYKVEETNLDYACVMEMTIINDSNIDYNIRANEIYVNGWKVSTHSTEINANRRMKESWYIKYKEADISGVSEIEDIEIYLSIYPDGGNRKKDSLDIPPVIISIK